MGSVRLQSTAKRPVTIELAALDAETAQTGGSSFAPTGTTPKAVGTWVRLAEPTVTLRPGEQKEVGFSVQAPESVEPGQYLAGIAAYAPNKPDQAAKRDENQAGASVDVQTRYVIAVQVNVPGAQVPSLTISSVSLLEQPAGKYIGVTMKNDGGVLLKPSGSIVITDSEGKRVLEEAIKMDTFVTGTEATYPVALPGAIGPGKYGVDVNLSYAKGKTARYSGALEIKAPAQPAAQAAERAPAGEQAEEQARPAVEGAAAQRPTQSASAIQPWMIYGMGGLLGLVAILLALNLLRGRGEKGSV